MDGLESARGRIEYFFDLSILAGREVQSVFKFKCKPGLLAFVFCLEARCLPHWQVLSSPCLGLPRSTFLKRRGVREKEKKNKPKKKRKKPLPKIHTLLDPPMKEEKKDIAGRLVPRFRSMQRLERILVRLVRFMLMGPEIDTGWRTLSQSQRSTLGWLFDTARPGQARPCWPRPATIFSLHFWPEYLESF